MLAVPLLIRFVQRLVHSLSNCCSTPPADTQFSLFHGFLGKSETKLSPCEVHRVVIRANGEVPMDFLESEESQLAAAGKDSPFGIDRVARHTTQGVGGELERDRYQTPLSTSKCTAHSD